MVGQKFGCMESQNRVIMDIHDWLWNIHDSIVGIHNSVIMDIRNLTFTFLSYDVYP